MNYDGKRFTPVSNSENGEVSSEMIFHYRQSDNILTCRYSGENILSGHLIGLVDQQGAIEMRYHQINCEGEFRTGICHSILETMDDGKILLREKWRWTSGNLSSGESILIEV